MCQLCQRNPGEIYERERSQSITTGIEEQETRTVVKYAERSFLQLFALCDECIAHEGAQARRSVLRARAIFFGVSLGIGLLAVPFILAFRLSILIVVPMAMAPVAFISLLVLLKTLSSPETPQQVLDRLVDRAYETWRREKRCEVCGELAKYEVILCYKLKIFPAGYRCAAHGSVDEPFTVMPIH